MDTLIHTKEGKLRISDPALSVGMQVRYKIDNDEQRAYYAEQEQQEGYRYGYISSEAARENARQRSCYAVWGQRNKDRGYRITHVSRKKVQYLEGEEWVDMPLKERY